MSEKGSNAIHNIMPAEVTIDNTKAFSISVGNITSRFTRDGVEYDLVSNCRFLSRLEMLEEQSCQLWKMLSMEVIYINDKISPILPFSGHKGMDFEGAGDFPRQSYKLLAYCLSQKGYQVKQDLPGTDDDRLVSEILTRNFSWLKA
jgi:hypothetical protein